jgi:integrase
MAIHKLTDLKIKAKLRIAQEQSFNPAAKNALLGDGQGLYLAISKTGTASWLFRYMDSGKAKSSGLGGYPSVSLQMARELAQRLRDARASGVDPQIAKRQRDEQRKLAENRVKTFSDCAADYIALTEPSWKSAKHAQQWRNTLAQYAEPVIGAMPVADVAAEHVLKILKPIWQTKAETASRLRGRIELILDWAAANGRRTGDNPARLKGHLEHMLPRLRSGTRQHHAAMHYEDVPALLDALEDHGGMSRYALEFLILCASRTGEVVGATWSEIDIGKRIWTIPKQRMKAGVEHRVPLSDRAIAILELIRPFTGDTYVFPGGKKDKPISNMAMMMLLRRMGHGEITVHGFRSSFRNWAGEQTNYTFEVCEQALAHRLPDAVAAAYLRTDFFDKRVNLMADWARHCLQGSS